MKVRVVASQGVGSHDLVDFVAEFRGKGEETEGTVKSLVNKPVV